MYSKKVKQRIQRIQKGLAAWLDNHFNHYTAKKKRIFLLIFCVLFSAVSAGLIARALMQTNLLSPSFRIGRIPKAAHIGKAFSQPYAFIDSATFLRVELFKKFLDSMAMHDRAQYKRILQARPGLMDSIRLFEKIYSSQSKNRLWYNKNIR